MARTGEGVVTLTRPSSLPGTVCPGCSVSVISLQRYMHGMVFSSPKEDSEFPKESLSHLLVFWSSLVDAVLQAGLCDPSGRWLTRAGS